MKLCADNFNLFRKLQETIDRMPSFVTFHQLIRYFSASNNR